MGKSGSHQPEHCAEHDRQLKSRQGRADNRQKDNGQDDEDND
jgi:hypothetical protein